MGNGLLMAFVQMYCVVVVVVNRHALFALHQDCKCPGTGEGEWETHCWNLYQDGSCTLQRCLAQWRDKTWLRNKEIQWRLHGASFEGQIGCILLSPRSRKDAAFTLGHSYYLPSSRPVNEPVQIMKETFRMVCELNQLIYW